MKWFDNLKFQNKLLIVFGVVTCIMIFFAAYSVTQVSRLKKDINQIVSYQQRQVRIADAIVNSFGFRIANLARGYAVETSQFENILKLNLDQYDDDINSFNDNLNNYRALVLSDPRLNKHDMQLRMNILDSIEVSFNFYMAYIEQLKIAVDNKEQSEVIRIMEHAIPAGSIFSSRLLSLRDLAFTNSQEKTIEIAEHIGIIINITIIVAIGFIVLVGFALLFTVNSINRPITKLEKEVADVINGNQTHLNRSERKDELGSLTNCISEMVFKLTDHEMLKDALQAAKAASVAKSSFLANMSHEIRTPMNAILGITEILLQNEMLEPEMETALQKIYNSGDLLLNIINDILDLSKIEAGKLELTLAKYDVASLINDTASLNMMRIGSKPIEFTLSVDENIPVALIGDELRIKQIMNNLLSNAFKYTSKGKVELSISSEQGSKENESLFTCRVSDTGQGMSKTQIDKLFEEYSRFNVEANSTTEGTGLGMSITHNLIELMKGSISVESETDRGTVFTVRLPQRNTNAGVMGKTLAESLQRFDMSSQKHKRRAQVNIEPMPYGSVLVVDDVESNLYVAKGLMAPYGLAVDTVISGFETIEKIKSGNVYDIIFMDHMMPLMDGIEATAKLREMGYTHPIVALTANAVVGQVDMFMENGFDDFISKPVDVRQLNIVLNRLIRDKQPPEVIEAARLEAEAKKEQSSNNNAEHAITPAFIEIIVRDTKKSLAIIEEIMERTMLEKAGSYDNNDLRTYMVNVHGVKSALANVRNMDLSAIALRLEKAAQDKNIEIITAETPAFLTSLQTFIEELSLEMEKANSITEGEINEDKPYLHEKLLAIKTACEKYDESAVEKALNDLKSKTWLPPVNKLLGTIAKHLIHSDFNDIAETINEFQAQ